jgi:drug/metabolite transporter (DMT)-like permease
VTIVARINWTSLTRPHWPCPPDQSARTVATVIRDPKPAEGGDDAVGDRASRGTAAGGGGARGTILAVAGAATAMAAVGSSFAVLDTLHDFPASGGQAARYAVAAVLLAALAGGRLPRPTRPQLIRLALLAITGLAAFNLLVMAAEASMDPGSVGVIVAAVPVLLALAGPLQDGRRPEPRVVGAAVIVAAGAAVVQGMGGELTVGGLAAALGALACEAAFSLLAAPLLKPLGPVAVSAWAAILAVPQLVVIGLVLDGPANFIRAPTLAEAAALAYLTVVVTAMAFVLWYSAVRTLGVERAGLLSGVLPVSALLAAAILGRSDLTAGRLAGAVAVGAGIAVGLASARPRRTGSTAGPAAPVARAAVTR